MTESAKTGSAMTRPTIHNPGNDDHFMRVKPVNATVRVRRGDRVLAESRSALRVMEHGKDYYDPVFYIPEADLTAALDPILGKTSHCPLKGDASYFALDGEEIAWTYDRPFEWSEPLRGHFAFWPGKVAFEEIGAEA